MPSISASFGRSPYANHSNLGSMCNMVPQSKEISFAKAAPSGTSAANSAEQARERKFWTGVHGNVIVIGKYRTEQGVS